jgi:hypothetical protein
MIINRTKDRKKSMLSLKDNNNTSTGIINNDILNDEYPKRILGGSLSTIFKYNLNEHFGISLIPEYTIFFRNFVKSNNTKYQQFSANPGIKFRF